MYILACLLFLLLILVCMYLCLGKILLKHYSLWFHVVCMHVGLSVYLLVCQSLYLSTCQFVSICLAACTMIFRYTPQFTTYFFHTLCFCWVIFVFIHTLANNFLYPTIYSSLTQNIPTVAQDTLAFKIPSSKSSFFISKRANDSSVSIGLWRASIVGACAHNNSSLHVPTPYPCPVTVWGSSRHEESSVWCWSCDRPAGSWLQVSYLLIAI